MVLLLVIVLPSSNCSAGPSDGRDCWDGRRDLLTRLGDRSNFVVENLKNSAVETVVDTQAIDQQIVNHIPVIWLDLAVVVAEAYDASVYCVLCLDLGRDGGEH